MLPDAPLPGPETPPSIPAPAAATLRPQFGPAQLLPVLGELARYQILGLMMDGAAHSASELGRIIGKSRMATSKHLACLRTAGLIEPCVIPLDRRATGFRLLPVFVPPAGAPRTLDFGWCLFRFE